MARGVVYAVFILPVIVSIFFGSIVMYEILNEPGRELNMWQFKLQNFQIDSNQSVKILGLENQYSTTAPIEITVAIDDEVFDCGDLYITIYDVSSFSKQVLTQSGFFEQCFDKNNLTLPVDDEFSEVIDTPGNYEVLVEMIDKNNKKTISSSAKFTVE